MGWHSGFACRETSRGVSGQCHNAPQRQAPPRGDTRRPPRRHQEPSCDHPTRSPVPSPAPAPRGMPRNSSCTWSASGRGAGAPGETGAAAPSCRWPAAARTPRSPVCTVCTLSRVDAWRETPPNAGATPPPHTGGGWGSRVFVCTGAALVARWRSPYAPPGTSQSYRPGRTQSTEGSGKPPRPSSCPPPPVPPSPGPPCPPPEGPPAPKSRSFLLPTVPSPPLVAR